MRNSNNIARLKKISVILLACLLLILVAVLVAPKQLANAPASLEQTQDKNKNTEPLAFIGPVKPASPPPVVTAKPKPKIINNKPAATATPAPDLSVPVFATQADAKAYLKTLLNDQQFIIMEAVIGCESGWSQYWEPGNWAKKPAGTVKISAGNVGFGQINRGAHEKRFSKMGIDIYSEKGNLQATAILFKEQFINPWKPYSGHCFLPKLKAKGISI